jgi:hypothetical protein
MKLKETSMERRKAIVLEMANSLGHRMDDFVDTKLPLRPGNNVRPITSMSKCKRCMKFVFVRQNRLPSESPKGGPATKYPCVTEFKARKKKIKIKLRRRITLRKAT